MRKSRRISQARILPVALLIPAILTIFALWVYPYLYLVFMTFFKTVKGHEEFVGLSNYLYLSEDSLFFSSLYTGLLFSAGSVCGTTLLGLAIALLLDMKLRGTRIYRTVILVPIVLPTVVSAMIWQILYNPAVGFFNYVLGLFGVPAIPWLGSSKTALFAILLFNIWQNSPFVVLIFSAALLTLPHEPFEAAAVDGASAWQVFRHVTLHLLKPTILLVLIFRTMWSFQALDEIFVMTGGGPGYSTTTLTIYAFLTSFFWLRFNYGSTLVLMAFLIVGLLTMAYIRMIRRAGA